MAERKLCEACERNKGPIAEVLDELLVEPTRLIEIASGTGQHAEFFAERYPHVEWQPTDAPHAADSPFPYGAVLDTPNLLPHVELDVTWDDWAVAPGDFVFCCNMIHYVAWPLVEALFEGLPRILKPGGVFFVYGPYRYSHRPIEPSNARFDEWLKSREPTAGVRLFDDIDSLARGAGLSLVEDRAMPANNRSIWWQMG